MPYRITWLEQTVIVSFYGEVSVQEVRDHGIEINADPRFLKVKKRISDCSRINDIAVNPMDIKIFASIDKSASSQNPQAHIAVVSDDSSVVKNTAEYKKAYGDGPWKIQVFKSIGDALAWTPEV